MSRLNELHKRKMAKIERHEYRKENRNGTRGGMKRVCTVKPKEEVKEESILDKVKRKMGLD